MFFGRSSKKAEIEQAERIRLNALSEKELLIELIIELKNISNQCNEIGRKIVIWSN